MPYKIGSCSKNSLHLILSNLWTIALSRGTNHPIIICCFELTRGANHLDDIYENFAGWITCDAYVSYATLEKEKKNVIFLCGCMMHMRRRFADALYMTKPSTLPRETLEALPEYKALVLIKNIYNADERLKVLSPEERKEKRDKEVRPIVNAFYTYIEGLNTSDPQMSEQLRDAIQYATGQKERLLRFLDDGNIPIDNGYVERVIRPFTILRRNCLFCNSVEGAKATGIIYSIVATAKANKANVYIYLQYLLEMLPKQTPDAWGNYHYDDAFLATMMPWSEEYKAYEKQYKSRPGCSYDVPLGPNQYREPPKMPGKSKQEESATPVA